MEPSIKPEPSDNEDIKNAINAIEANKTDPKTVVMLSMDGCPWCEKVKALLPSSGYKLVEVKITDTSKFQNEFMSNPYNKNQKITFPRCFIEGKLIGGHDDLVTFLNSKKPESKPEPKHLPKPPTTSKPSPSTLPSVKNARLEEGVLPKVSDMFSGRKLDFAPIAATVNSNIDPLFSDLKRCLCEGFADIFASISPLIIDRIVDSMKDSVKNDPKIQEYIQSRLIQLISEIKSSSDKDMILTNLNGECKEVFTV